MCKQINILINQKSIAVLPFVNMSSDIDNEYFCDGITEEIINALTTVKGLKVIARTSSFAFKNKNIDVRHIGNQLGVATVLEGSVRKSGNRVRITAQLIDTKDGTHYWSRNFDKELVDIFKLQDEISLFIANELRNNFGHFEIKDRLVKETTNNIKAYELYLKGRYYQLQWTSESINLAIEYYDKAIAIDTKYAKAYYANLQCYGLLAAWGFMPQNEGMQKAINNFLIAKEIDTKLPEYPLSLVGRSFWKEWDFKSAYTYIKQVLSINPNHIDGLEAMAELFIAHGFFNQALIYAHKLLNVDPLSANNQYTLANIYYYQEDYETALKLVKSAINIRPDLELANHLYLFCLIGLKRKEEFNEAIKNQELSKFQNILYSVINEGVSKIPNTILEELSETESENSQLTPYHLLIIANTEHKDLAFSLLQKYIEQRRGQIINYRQEPLLKPLREFPEFDKLHLSNLLISDIDIEKNNQQDSKNLLNKKELIRFKTDLLKYFNEQKPYLDSKINMTTVAEEINLHPNKLSYLINELMDVNFNDYINQYRLNHFMKIALDPKLKHITILGLAYDSGFNSKSVFNTYFKKTKGITPSEWIKSKK